jgi:hypothetical protein
MGQVPLVFAIAVRDRYRQWSAMTMPQLPLKLKQINFGLQTHRKRPEESVRSIQPVTVQERRQAHKRQHNDIIVDVQFITRKPYRDRRGSGQASNNHHHRRRDEEPISLIRCCAIALNCVGSH